MAAPKSAKPARAPRVIKSHKQRATERLAATQAAYDRSTKAVDKLKAALEVAETEQAALRARLDHAKADPDLRDDPQLPLGGE
jgi:phage shock protein A